MPLACPSGLPYPLSAWVAQALLSTNPSSCALPPTCLLQTLLRNHGVVCISRTGSDTARLLDKPGTLLNTYRCVGWVELACRSVLCTDHVACLPAQHLVTCTAAGLCLL